MSKKKVTAPLSYDPGKGRPKEYLAYLNWQEMQELMRINGNNVELGPRGLPSFPPDDAIGSNQTPGTGNWTGSPGSGTTSGGAGGTTGGGSDSGNVGGSVGGTTTSAASTSSAGSQQASNDTEAQQAAAQQNAAEAARNEALRQDAARGGINSINVGPMQNPVKIGGGQIFGSLSSMAQQVARPTAVVSTTTPSGVPVGGANYYHRMTDSLPGMQSPEKFSTKITPSNLVTEYGVDLESWTNAYNPNKLTPGAQKIHQAIVDESLRENQPVSFISGKRGYNAGTGTRQHPAGQAIDIVLKDPKTGLPVGYEKIGERAYNPIASVRKDRSGNYIRTPEQASRIEAALNDPYRDFATGVIGSFYSNPGVYGEFNNQRWGGSFRGGEWEKDYMHFDEGKVTSGVSADQALLRTEAAYRAQNAPYSGTNALASFGGVYSPASNYASIPSIQPASSTYEAAAPPTGSSYAMMDPVARAALSGIANLPGTLSNFSIPSIPEPNFVDKMARMALQRSDPEKFQKTVNEAMADATSGFSAADAFTSGIGALKQAMGPPQTAVAENEIQNVEDQYRQPVGVSASVIPGEFNYPVKPDGTPYTEQDLAGLPPEIMSEYMDKKRFARMTDEPYPLTPEEQQRVFVAKGLGRVALSNPVASTFVRGVNLLGQGLGYMPGSVGEFGEGIAEGTGQLRDPGEAVASYLRADPFQKIQIGMRAGKPNQIPGIAPDYTGTTYAGGTPTQEPGGKGNEFRQFASYTPQYTPGPESQISTRGGERSQQYYLWDLGVGIPSPGDPDYNDYQKYLRERGTSAAV